MEVSSASSCPMFEWHKIENASGVFFSSSVILNLKTSRKECYAVKSIFDFMCFDAKIVISVLE